MAPIGHIEKSKAYYSDGSPAFLNVFLDGSDAVVVTNNSWNIVFVNKRACSLSGYTSEELLTRKISDYFDPEKGLETATAFARLTETGSISFLHRVKRRNGALMEIAVTATSLNADHFLFNIKDQNADKVAEAENSTTAAMLSATFDHSPFGMSLISPEGRWMKVNRSFCDITGYSECELLQMQLSDIVHADDFAGFESMLAAMARGHRNSSFRGKKVPQQKWLHRVGENLCIHPA